MKIIVREGIMRRIAIAVAVVVLAGIVTVGYLLFPRGGQVTGAFKGNPRGEFLSQKSGDGHLVEIFLLMEPFAYTDGKGVEWAVPSGHWSDGASVPRYLWALLGGPFSGPYR